MKLLLVCLVLIAFTASLASRSKESQLLKQLLGLLEDKRAESAQSEKRYLYQDATRKSPSVDSMRPGEMRVDLQMDVSVMNTCPTCRMFVNYQCVSSTCHNKDELRFPPNGYTWAEFKRLFVETTQHEGVWKDGLENGMTYEVWDSVMLNDIPYSGYSNSERRSIVIP